MVKHVLIIQISMGDLFALLWFSKTPVLFEGTLSWSCMAQVKSLLFFLFFFLSSSIVMCLFRRGPASQQQTGVSSKWNSKVQGFWNVDVVAILKHRATILSGQMSATLHKPLHTHLAKLFNCDWIHQLSRKTSKLDVCPIHGLYNCELLESSSLMMLPSPKRSWLL